MVKDNVTTISPADERRNSHNLRQYIEELEYDHNILTALQDVTLDGVLVVDEQWNMVLFNRRFINMWDIPSHIVEARDDKKSIQTVLNKLKYPENFLARVEALMEHPEETSKDELELLDGRFFDRYSAPIVDKMKNLRGRVWFFRDITETKQAKRTLRERNRKLEETVAYRTRKLEKAYKKLCTKEKELEAKNIGLKAVLHVLESEKKSLENRISANFSHALLPLIADVQENANNDQLKQHCHTIQLVIQDLTTGMNLKLMENGSRFTPTQMKIINHIKHGKTTKEIAAIVNCSPRTIDGHRAGIRKKLQLARDCNLLTALQDLS